MKQKPIQLFLLILSGLILLSLVGWWSYQAYWMPKSFGNQFDGDRALHDLKSQVDLGPRTPGSEGHKKVVEWITQQLKQANWQVEIQQASTQGIDIQNIIAHRLDKGPRVILGAHYDTRLFADQDPDSSKRTMPVPGANDAASGVAVLLELARVLPSDLSKNVTLVFFDAEDQGEIQGQQWSIGSTYYAQSLTDKPEAVVVLDMIGDADLNIHTEGNSNPQITRAIWDAAQKLGYSDKFIPTPKYTMIDDHTPFLQRGFPAVDIIDFDYPYWHTTQDTPDKVSAASLKVVGDTLIHWLNP
jgi:glutaminyl-peptide cyclotransferase